MIKQGMRILLAAGIGIGSAAWAQDETPEAKGARIALQADQANSGWASERATMSMELINAQGDKTSRKLVVETLEGSTDGDRSRVVFEWPADVKETKLLTWSHKDGNDDQWLYLPAVKRVKRISSSNKSGSFMGSELAYEDLGSQEPEKYRYKWLEDVQEKGRDCWKLERVPVSKNSGYSRHVVWMDKEYHLPIHIDYYDRKNELLKTSYYTGHEKHDSIWKIGVIDVTNVQTKKKSILTWSDRKLGVALDPAQFEPTALEN